MAGGLWAALAGYIFTYYNSQKTEQRRARIDRINAQLRDLYGPLLACVTATKSAYEACWKQHSPDGTRAGFQRALYSKPDGPEGTAYRQWMVSVLQPLNEKAADVITGGISLLEGSNIEPQLLQLVAHTASYRVLLERWSLGDYSRFSSSISYPDRLEEWTRREFARLKELQAELIGVNSPAQKLARKARIGNNGHSKHSSQEGGGKRGEGGGSLDAKDTGQQSADREGAADCGAGLTTGSTDQADVGSRQPTRVNGRVVRMGQCAGASGVEGSLHPCCKCGGSGSKSTSTQAPIIMSKL